eukprot:scaffold8602_cov196-Amphora_coffeaeformis.AAC.30
MASEKADDTTVSSLPTEPALHLFSFFFSCGHLRFFGLSMNHQYPRLILASRLPVYIMLASNDLVPTTAADSAAGMAAAESSVLSWLTALYQNDQHSIEEDSSIQHHVVLTELLHTLRPRMSNRNCPIRRHKVNVLLRNGCEAITTALLQSCRFKRNHSAAYFEATLHIMFLLLHQDSDDQISSLWTAQDMEIARIFIDKGFVECFYWYIHKGGKKSRGAFLLCFRLIDSIFSAIYFGCGICFQCCFQCSPDTIYHRTLNEFANSMLPGFIQLMTDCGLKATCDVKEEAEASKTFKEGMKNMKWFFLSGSVDTEDAIAIALSNSLADLFEHNSAVEMPNSTTQDLLRMLLRGIAHFVFDLEIQDLCLSFVGGMIGNDMANNYMQGIEAQYHIRHWKCGPAA